MSVNIYKNNQLITIAGKSSGGGGGGGSTWLSKNKVLNKNDWIDMASTSKITNWIVDISSLFTYNNELYYISGDPTTMAIYLYKWENDASWVIVTTLPEGFMTIPEKVFIYDNEIHILGVKMSENSSSFGHYAWNGSTWREITNLSTLSPEEAFGNSISPLIYDNEVHFLAGNHYVFDGNSWSEVSALPDSSSQEGSVPIGLILKAVNEDDEIVNVLTCVQSGSFYVWNPDELDWVLIDDLPNNFTPLINTDSGNIWNTGVFTLPYYDGVTTLGVLGLKTERMDYGTQIYLSLYKYDIENTQWEQIYDVPHLWNDENYIVSCIYYNNKLHLFNAHYYSNPDNYEGEGYYYYTYNFENDNWVRVSEMPCTVYYFIQNFIYKNQIHLLIKADDSSEAAAGGERVQYWYENEEWVDNAAIYNTKQVITDSDFTTSSNAIIGLDPLATSSQQTEVNKCHIRALDFEEGTGETVGLVFIGNQIPNEDIPVNILFEQGGS